MIYIYCTVLGLILIQNVSAWSDAGKLAEKSSESAHKIVATHEGEWGSPITRLVVYNVPDAYMGAYVYRVGFEEMLRNRTGSELFNVKMEIHLEGGQ